MIACSIAWLLAAGAGRRALAVAIDDPDIGGIGFSGPTTGDLAAVYWNPAALGLIHGVQVMFGATGRLTTTTVAPVDPVTGLALPRARASDFTHPFSWPPGPGAFAGVAADVGGDRFSLAFATYMPFADHASYQNGDDPTLSTRYHRISADLRNLALVPALAVRFAGDLRLGFAPGFLFSTGRLSFDDDTACGVNGNPSCGQDPSGDARYNISSSPGFQSARFALTLGGGLYYRTRSWEFGVSFSSRPFAGTGSDPAGISGADTQVIRPARDGGGPVTCMNGRTDGRGCVYADLSYKLPFTFIAGVTWHPAAGVEVSAVGRLLSFPANDVVDIRLTGASLAADGLPQHVVLYRGYGTVLDTRLRYAEWLGHWLRVGAGLRFENSALAPDAISPGAVDGAKLEPTAMVTVLLFKHVSIGAGYGFTYMFGVTANNSVFDPAAASACEAAGGDLTPGSACYKRLTGQARPSAAGTYQSHQHDFSLSLTMQF